MGEIIAMLSFGFFVLIVLPIVVWVYAYRKGVRWSCPNCAQTQIGWSTQCPRCGVVFKEWED